MPRKIGKVLIMVFLSKALGSVQGSEPSNAARLPPGLCTCAGKQIETNKVLIDHGIWRDHRRTNRERRQTFCPSSHLGQ